MTTHQNYGALTPGSKVALAFSERLEGKVVVVTGVSPNSIGEALSINLAKGHPERLILASRSISKLETVAEAVRKQSPKTLVDTILLDLSSQMSVRKAAGAISKLVDHIDILINNAAVVTPQMQRTAESIELQFGVGHIGHFLFTNLMLPLLKVSAQVSESGTVRIINVSSEGHRVSPVRFHDYNFGGNAIPDDEQANERMRSKDGAYSAWVAYGQSKTANILFSVALNERLEKDGIRSYALHPGAIKTDLSRNMDAEDIAFLERLVAGRWVTPDQGTSTILVAALDPALDRRWPGCYLKDCGFEEAAAHATDPELAKKLWVLSEELTALKPLDASL